MDKKAQKRINQPLIEASFERSRVTALLGARRVGKTTLLRSYINNTPHRKWVFLNMDKREERLDIENERLREIIEERALQRIGQEEKIWVAIDEAQKCPALFEQVKVLYDDYKDQDVIKIILTGSGHLNLHQLASESLAGRVELMHLREFSLIEMASLQNPSITFPKYQALNLLIENGSEKKLKAAYEERKPFQKILSAALETHLVWGGLPEALEEQTSQDRLRYLGNYLQTYLENDVRAIETITDLNLYQQLMRICAEQTGPVRDDQRCILALHCARNTLVKYRGYLSATLQFLDIFPYINSTVKRVVKSPKGYLLNNGLISYLTGIHDLNTLQVSALLGHRYENWVLNELLTWTDSLVEKSDIFFWRTGSGTEVDFIVSIGHKVIPIEVTYSSQVLPKKIRHLHDFMEKEPKAEWGVYVYTGPFKVDHEKRIISLPPWLI